MPTSFKQELPADSVAITATGLASLATSSTLVAGYALAAVSNRSNLDITHLLSAKIMMGTTPTINTTAEMWMIPAVSYASGSPVWPACFSSSYSGSAGAFTVNSRGVLAGAGIPLKAWLIDLTTTGTVFECSEIDLAAFNGGTLPFDYFLWFTHSNVAAWNATGSNFVVSYTRVRYQGV